MHGTTSRWVVHGKTSTTSRIVHRTAPSSKIIVHGAISATRKIVHSTSSKIIVHGKIAYTIKFVHRTTSSRIVHGWVSSGRERRRGSLTPLHPGDCNITYSRHFHFTGGDCLSKRKLNNNICL